MLLESTSYTAFPALDPSSSFAFYPYTLSTNSRTTTSIRGLPPANHADHDPDNRAGPGPTTDDILREKLARARSERRALMGRRPPGVALGREAEELSNEEAALDDEKQNINLFGHRFLLPFGRRLTQMEMDAAPSPSPSEPDQERRQEDHDAQSPTSPLLAQPPQEIADEPAGEEVDLDASIEDMDASMDDGQEGEQEDNEEHMDDE